MIGVGIDAGGTTTRWIALHEDGRVFSEGNIAGLTALMLHTDVGVSKLKSETVLIGRALKEKFAQTNASSNDVIRVCAGFTGIDSHSPELAEIIAASLATTASNVKIMSDIEVAFRGVFQPNEGYLVYAGTGSIAVFIDANDEFQRAGGRGVGLDDGGGGYWMAREALRQIWRREDERPGAWKDSSLACAMFKRIGGSDWDESRKFFYSRERGEIGALALSLQETADSDPLSREILRGAGIELARLGAAMMVRYGPRPIALSGRASRLHPIIEATMRERLPSAKISMVETQAHHTAARMALKYERTRGYPDDSASCHPREGADPHREQS
jgi:glucosamine kinase